MTWELDIVGRPLRTLVLVSKAGHCLNDLLYRERAGQRVTTGRQRGLEPLKRERGGRP